MSLPDSRESVDQEARYFWFDTFVDQAQRGEITLTEAFNRYERYAQQLGNEALRGAVSSPEPPSDY